MILWRLMLSIYSQMSTFATQMHLFAQNVIQVIGHEYKQWITKKQLMAQQFKKKRTYKAIELILIMNRLLTSLQKPVTKPSSLRLMQAFMRVS